MKNNTYGYIRVSSRDQCEDRQRIAMREAGVEDDRIYMDKQSGKSTCFQQSCSADTAGQRSAARAVRGETGNPTTTTNVQRPKRSGRSAI